MSRSCTSNDHSSIWYHAYDYQWVLCQIGRERNLLSDRIHSLHWGHVPNASKSINQLSKSDWIGMTRWLFRNSRLEDVERVVDRDRRVKKESLIDWSVEFPVDTDFLWKWSKYGATRGWHRNARLRFPYSSARPWDSSKISWTHVKAPALTQVDKW